MRDRARPSPTRPTTAGHRRLIVTASTGSTPPPRSARLGAHRGPNRVPVPLTPIRVVPSKITYLPRGDRVRPRRPSTRRLPGVDTIAPDRASTEEAPAKEPPATEQPNGSGRRRLRWLRRSRPHRLVGEADDIAESRDPPDRADVVLLDVTHSAQVRGILASPTRRVQFLAFRERRAEKAALVRAGPRYVTSGSTVPTFRRDRRVAGRAVFSPGSRVRPTNCPLRPSPAETSDTVPRPTPTSTASARGRGVICARGRGYSKEIAGRWASRSGTSVQHVV